MRIEVERHRHTVQEREVCDEMRMIRITGGKHYEDMDDVLREGCRDRISTSTGVDYQSKENARKFSILDELDKSLIRRDRRRSRRQTEDERPLLRRRKVVDPVHQMRDIDISSVTLLYPRH